MASFSGTGGADTITPGFVSLAVAGSGTPGDDGDTIIGNGGDDLLDGGGGDDVLYGGGGANTVIGGAGADTLNPGNPDPLGNLDDRLEGGSGDDVYLLYAAAQAVELADDGIDSALLLHENGVLPDNVENGQLIGHVVASGNALDNALIGNAVNNVLNGLDGNDSLSGLDGADTLSGAAGADTLAGGGAADTLVGQGGNDVLNGGAGADSMMGGANSDRYTVDDAGDVVIEDAVTGVDVVSSFVDWTLGENVGQRNLLGSALNGFGNGLANRIAGNAMDNPLIGFSGNDVLLGGDGADTLVGGPEKDAMTGGAGADRFLFNATSEGVDRVADFAPGQDVLAMAAANFVGLPAGALAAAHFVAHAANTATAAAGVPQFIYNIAAGALFFDADGLGGAAALRLAVLTGAPALSAADIVLV